jgi:L-aminopeptidase/D-esterase-like protein
MRKTILFVGLFALTAAVSACDSDAERGLVGAGAGALISDATGGSKTAGAIIGGAAGVFCDDVGICK